MKFATSHASPATQHVQARRIDDVTAHSPFATPKTSLAQDIAMARVVARMMDSQFQLGPMRFGLDSVLGLVPVVGDAVTFAIGLYPIHLARKHKLGKLVVGRMLANLGTDFLIGLVPLAGDAADVFFKAQLKNLALLESAARKRGVVLDEPTDVRR